jgi:light-regulated signal transduction histidine kinase (bacteriophytochrome)
LPYLYTGLPIMLNSVQCLVGLGIDITERKRAEEALQRAHDELETRVRERTAELAKANESLTQSNIELQQFAYIASHDLQTPLRAISGFAQLLQKQQQGKLGEKADHQIQHIVGGVKRMQTLINDLLSYARVEANPRPLCPTDMNAVFQDVVGLLSAAISETGGQVTRAELPTVVGDRGQLVQLLQNLIGNGLKFHGGHPPLVHVSAERTVEGWMFSVRDNGIGIPPQHHERIFEIFRRLHSQQEYPGTGIGLAVCKRVVHRHGGRIWLKSDCGEGTTFFFSIPDSPGEKR